MRSAAPRWVCLQLLQACNLRCSMCYEWGTTGVHTRGIQPSMLAFDVVARVIGELAPHRPHFDLFGGEPLLYPQLAKVLQLIKAGGSTVDIATNGTSLEERADLLASAPADRLWVSIDGPPRINDGQRGLGTFSSVVRGIAALRAARRRRDSPLPRLGITFVVTPLNHHAIEETFLKVIDRESVDCVSIEYQSYLSSAQLGSYEQLLHERFGTEGVRYAAGLVREPSEFSGIDTGAIARQIERVRAAYETEGRRVLTRPRVTTSENSAAYFEGRFESMADTHSRCVFPWLYAEISARGDVTPCHSFYDLTFGNVNEQPLLEIWRSERFEDARRHWRSNLLPVCHACCLYHTEPTTPS